MAKSCCPAPGLAHSFRHSGRSNGKRLPPTSGFSPKGPRQNAGFQVKDQKPPTSGNPVRQHKQFAASGLPSIRKY